MHDAGQQLDKEDDADNAEGVGDTVSDGCQRGMGAVDGYGKSRRTGQSAGYQPHNAGGVYAESVFQHDGSQGGRADNQH